jgi:hypothetical protein
MWQVSLTTNTSVLATWQRCLYNGSAAIDRFLASRTNPIRQLPRLKQRFLFCSMTRVLNNAKFSVAFFAKSPLCSMRSNPSTPVSGYLHFAAITHYKEIPLTAVEAG